MKDFVITVMFFGMFVGVGYELSDVAWKIETVERNLAEYNGKTGKWQWKENSMSCDHGGSRAQK